MLDDDNDVTVLFHRIIRYPCCWRLSKSENVELGFIIYNDICQKNLQFFFHRSSHSFFYLFHLFFLNFFFLLLYLFRYIQSLVFMSSEKSAWNQIMLKFSNKLFWQFLLCQCLFAELACYLMVLLDYWAEKYGVLCMHFAVDAFRHFIHICFVIITSKVNQSIVLSR